MPGTCHNTHKFVLNNEKITIVITLLKPVLINEPVLGQYTSNRATENGQNTMAPLCILVQLTHVHTHGLTKEMRPE